MAACLAFGKTVDPLVPEPFQVPGFCSERRRIHPDGRVAFGSAGVGLGVPFVPVPARSFDATPIPFSPPKRNGPRRPQPGGSGGYWGALAFFLTAAIDNGWLFANARA